MLTWAIVYLIAKTGAELPVFGLIVALLCDASIVYSIAQAFGAKP